MLVTSSISRFYFSNEHQKSQPIRIRSHNLESTLKQCPVLHFTSASIPEQGWVTEAPSQQRETIPTLSGFGNHLSCCTFFSIYVILFPLNFLV